MGKPTVSEGDAWLGSYLDLLFNFYSLLSKIIKNYLGCKKKKKKLMLYYRICLLIRQRKFKLN